MRTTLSQPNLPAALRYCEALGHVREGYDVQHRPEFPLSCTVRATLQIDARDIELWALDIGNIVREDA